MSDILNYILIAVFGSLGIIYFVRYFKNHGRIMIQDQQWSYIRIMFLVLGVLAIMTLVTQHDEMTFLDYVRVICMIVAVSAYMIVRDGVGETGMVSAGKFYPWSEVRAYDYSEQKNVIEVYFTVESQKKDNPDDYTTKELDFAKTDKDILLRFLEINLGRKYTRMKKKSR